METMFNYTPALAGKTAVVTGATSGIGLATATLLALHGARIIGVGRDEDRCRKAQDTIHHACPEARITFHLADLSSRKQIFRLASEILALNLTCLDILVNNAGTYSQKKHLTEDGFEKTFATNHLAPFLLTRELLPLLEKSSAGRVITVSSDSHYFLTIDPQTIHNPAVYLGILAYGQSKLANILFTAEFNRRYSSSSVHAYAVDPGLVKTNIAFKEQPLLSRLVWKLRSSAGVDPEIPARGILHLASEPSIQHSPESYWYDRKPRKASRQAGDAVLARELWDTSNRLCGNPGLIQET